MQNDNVKKCKTCTGGCNYDADVGKRTKEVRVKNRLTQMGFIERISLQHEEAVNLVPSTISKIENGNETLPHWLLHSISREFGVSTDWILFGEPTPYLTREFEDCVLQLAEMIKNSHSGK